MLLSTTFDNISFLDDVIGQGEVELEE